MIEPRLSNRVREERIERGWSQMQLAERARISRPLVSAIEMGRLVPSTMAALALAAAFNLQVEHLFILETEAQEDWAWPPRGEVPRFWRTCVGTRRLRVPTEGTAIGMIPPDDPPKGFAGADPMHTLVIAGCDPAVGLLVPLLLKDGIRLIPLIRSSAAALDLLVQGRVHMAGLHVGQNKNFAEASLGNQAQLVAVADWETGIALGRSTTCQHIRQALRGKLRWVGRPTGSGARMCLDRLFEEEHQPLREPLLEASDHTAVAEIVRTGYADAGICLRLAADQAGLRFLSVQREPYDLCTTRELIETPGVKALLRALRSSHLRHAIADLSGYHADRTGEVLSPA